MSTDHLGRGPAWWRAGLAGWLVGACVTRPPRGVTPPVEGVPGVVSRRFEDLTIHVVNTGWVRVKEAHRTLAGPTALRMPSILLDRRWTEFMPMLVGVVEHPEGVFLVDAGLSEETLDPDHFACDPATAFVYQNLLDFRFEPAQRIDHRLAALGVAPERVRGVVLTHLHADHADALVHLPPGVEVFVGAGDWPGHQGALRCRWPRTSGPTLVDGAEPGAAGSPLARPLTTDGRLHLVSLRGHSPGHLGLLVHTAEVDVLFAGDAAFSLDQVATRTLAGIVESPDAARRTLDRLAQRVTTRPTHLLFAHDPESLERFARGQLTTLPARSAALTAPSRHGTDANAATRLR